jgi:hypothetical protein
MDAIFEGSSRPRLWYSVAAEVNVFAIVAKSARSSDGPDDDKVVIAFATLAIVPAAVGDAPPSFEVPMAAALPQSPLAAALNAATSAAEYASDDAAEPTVVVAPPAGFAVVAGAAVVAVPTDVVVAADVADAPVEAVAACLVVDDPPPQPAASTQASIARPVPLVTNCFVTIIVAPVRLQG